MDLTNTLKLVNFNINNSDKDLFEKQVSQVIEYNVDKIGEIDVKGIEPTYQAIKFDNILQDDIPCPSLEVSEVLANTAVFEKGMFKIKAVFGE